MGAHVRSCHATDPKSKFNSFLLPKVKLDLITIFLHWSTNVHSWGCQSVLPKSPPFLDKRFKVLQTYLTSAFPCIELQVFYIWSKRMVSFWQSTLVSTPPPTVLSTINLCSPTHAIIWIFSLLFKEWCFWFVILILNKVLHDLQYSKNTALNV